MPARGQRHTEEARKAMSLARRGVRRKPRSEETKAKIAAKARGRLHTPEARAKMSATHSAKAAIDPTLYSSHLKHFSKDDHWNWQGGISRNEAWRVRHLIRTHNVRVRRGGIRHTAGSFTYEEWRDKCALLGNVCMYCGEAKPLTIDHKIPLSRGGSNEIINIVPACARCNKRKGGRTAQEFLMRRAA